MAKAKAVRSSKHAVPGTEEDAQSSALAPGVVHELRPAFAPCACGVLLLTQVCDHKTGWRQLVPPVLPVTGNEHVCRKES